MIRILANGTFDILHPGHLYYLRESKKLGDELWVMVARDSMIDKETVIPERQRRDMVEGLKPVDNALLGSEDSIFDPLDDIQPDIITVGHDQDFNKRNLKNQLKKRGFNPDIVRIKKKSKKKYEINSTSEIINKIKEIR